MRSKDELRVLRATLASGVPGCGWSTRRCRRAHLPIEERASLAHKLIASIDAAPTTEIEEAWLREVDQRAEQVKGGDIELVPGDEVSRKGFARRRQK